MNPTPAPEADGPGTPQHRGQDGPAAPGTVEATTVPRQKTPHDPAACAPGSDLAARSQDVDALDDPDPLRAADAAGTESLLRCWTRENDLPRPDGDTLRIAFPASGTALLVPVHYWSATGAHRFGAPVLENAPNSAPPADAATVAVLIGREGGESGAGDLVARVADSVRHTAGFIEQRRRSPADPADADLFLTAEQSLLLGHPLHPTPKSREGLSEAESRRYSPELHGSFPLHWFAVDRSLAATDSAWTEGGPATAEVLLAPHAEGLKTPPGTVAVPVHPWQAADLLHRPQVRALAETGLLHDLGPHGEPWHPTSSIRTVHRPGARVMLKLSLGVRITNSRRENLRKELHRGVEVHRLLSAGLAEHWQREHPGFDIVRDPAWLAVDDPEGTPVTGLDVVLRHNPFGPGDDAACIAGLTAQRPRPGRPGMHSRLAEVISGLTARTGLTGTDVSAEWFRRYLHHVVRPVLWLDAHGGVALEAHQQNTLVLLDPDGWPVGGRYRDNQGYYFRDSRRAELDQRLPGIGTVSDTFVSDPVTDERFAYYLGINNVLGLIGAFGSQRLADEQQLLTVLRQFLDQTAELGSPLPAYLLENRQLRCKANLLTRLHGLDELVGPVDTQSVYVTIANPLHS
ncbi:IucA/IucC family siderophore biosynthesis protein [Streptomyces sp. PTY087I2]|uniref:IucA/IucC family protein n=1 Tax=Streptomyces sp. PTY087I2 TaxID=1819298 RepID=UPI00080B7002|nr:IucA/IucC family protein [Streptomyces sp. PTY087I2]OCC12054.1 N(2)-citryl-N(6)-acetyl-N(6)-hydroxylysine synthase [Streptomyces sp. PTY087I2]